MEDIEQYAHTINDIENNPYFVILTKIPTKESFVRSQRTFVTAIDFWSKILASVMMQMPSDKERTVIMKNLWDEHGCGNPANSHVETFKEFMRSLGSDNLTVGYLHADSGVLNFIKSLNGLYETHLEPKDYGDKDERLQLVYAVAALGMIEFTYVTVSKRIHQYALTFLEPKTISHYSIHETIDVGHARDLFSLVGENWLDSDFQNDVKRGIETGYRLMYDLYENLSKYLEL